MLLKWQFNLLTALGLLAIVLVAANATLFSLNRESQSALSQQQLFIQQTVPLEGLYHEIVNAIAELGKKNHDPQLLGILAAQGLSVSMSGPAANAAEAPVVKGAKEK
jgi:hypothetical protein